MLCFLTLMLVELTVLNAVCAENLMADCADREACFGRDELAAVVAGAEHIGEPRDYDGIFNGGLFHDSSPFLFDSPFSRRTSAQIKGPSRPCGTDTDSVICSFLCLFLAVF